MPCQHISLGKSWTASPLPVLFTNLICCQASFFYCTDMRVVSILSARKFRNIFAQMTYCPLRFFTVDSDMIQIFQRYDLSFLNGSYGPEHCDEQPNGLHIVQRQSQMGFGTCVRDILLLLLHHSKRSREETEGRHGLKKRGRVRNKRNKDLEAAGRGAHKHTYSQ